MPPTKDTQTVFRFKVEKSLLSKVQSLAKKDSRTSASWIRKVILEAVARSKNGN